MFDIRCKLTPAKDQGKRSTCVAFAATAGNELLRGSAEDLSEEHLYWGCKKIDGVFLDNGTSLDSALKALKIYGQSKEEYWPYNELHNVASSNYNPSDKAKSDALKYRIVHSEKIGRDLGIIQKKLTCGYAVVIGVYLFKEFFIPQNGFIDLPQNASQNFGGHAVLVAGWDSNIHNGVLIIRNSWGKSWGIGGYGYISFDYFNKYTIDACCFRIN